MFFSILVLIAGYFPTHTLTEDYALGMEMRRKGWRGMYVEDELVRGSAPDKIRGAFGQRSRWCKVGLSSAPLPECLCECVPGLVRPGLLLGTMSPAMMLREVFRHYVLMW